jgi:hypothetical protein
LELLFARDAEPTRLSTGGNDDGIRHKDIA